MISSEALCNLKFFHKSLQRHDCRNLTTCPFAVAVRSGPLHCLLHELRMLQLRCWLLGCQLYSGEAGADAAAHSVSQLFRTRNDC